MSRIGKKPVAIPTGVKVELKGQTVKVSGPLGKLEMDCHPTIEVAVESSENKIDVVNPRPDDRAYRAMHGTMRALIANMVTGVSTGFDRKMQIFGTGYSVKEVGGKLVFQIGFCHPVELAIPKDIKVIIDVPATRGNDIPARFTVAGADKCVLGEFAANIRRVRPPEPYKGKGIRYADEHVQRKVGKAFASGGA
jgi:large subunit ribosomal protein L6